MDSYLLESVDFLSIEKEKEKIIKDNNFKNIPINSYDLEEQTLELALEDLDTYGFLTDKKIIIIKNI